MFDFLKKFMGGGAPVPADKGPATVHVTPASYTRAPAPADTDTGPPPRAPVSVEWNGLSSDPVAVIQINLSADRTKPGTLVCLDADGSVVSGPWSAVGKSDDGAAAAKGNPGRDRLLPFGDTPTGVYEVIDRLPPQPDIRALNLFGPYPALRLRPVSGEAARADSNGRTSLLIHGGGDGGAATDGSVRIPDEAMKDILATIPDMPGAMRPRIRVVVAEVPDARSGAWQSAPAQVTSAAARAWRSSPGSYYSSYSSRGIYGVNPAYYDDDGLFWLLYQNWYYQDLAMQQAQAAADMQASAGYYDPSLPPQAIPSDTDSAVSGAAAPYVAPDAGSALAGAGYIVLPDGVSTAPAPAPDQGQVILPDVASSVTPDTTPASEPGWSPSGGAYGR